MSASRWRRYVRNLAVEHGAIVEVTGGNHYRIRHPSGWFVICPSTPSNERTLLHTRTQLRRAKREAEL